MTWSYDDPRCTCIKSNRVQLPNGLTMLRAITYACPLHDQSGPSPKGLPDMTPRKMRAWCARTPGGAAVLLATIIEMMGDPTVADVGQQAYHSFGEMFDEDERLDGEAK